MEKLLVAKAASKTLAFDAMGEGGLDSLWAFDGRGRPSLQRNASKRKSRKWKCP